MSVALLRCSDDDDEHDRVRPRCRSLLDACRSRPGENAGSQRGTLSGKDSYGSPSDAGTAAKPTSEAQLLACSDKTEDAEKNSCGNSTVIAALTSKTIMRQAGLQGGVRLRGPRRTANLRARREREEARRFAGRVGRDAENVALSVGTGEAPLMGPSSQDRSHPRAARRRADTIGRCAPQIDRFGVRFREADVDAKGGDLRDRVATRRAGSLDRPRSGSDRILLEVSRTART
jgi:hypothetical protein